MKNKISIKDQFMKLRDQIKKYNKSYYNSISDITDAEFDKLKIKYGEFLKKDPLLKKFDNIGVGTLPSSKFKKVQHIVPMLSLSNSFDLDDLSGFFNKANKHWKIEKKLDNNNMESFITNLNENDRINEIASLISGSKITEESKKVAVDLINEK